MKGYVTQQPRWPPYCTGCCNPSTTQKMSRETYSLTRVYRPGEDNVADPLSRHPNFSQQILAAINTRYKGNRPHSNTTPQHSRKRKERVDSRPSPAKPHEDADRERRMDAILAPQTQQSTPYSQKDFMAEIQAAYCRDKWFSNANTTINKT